MQQRSDEILVLIQDVCKGMLTLQTASEMDVCPFIFFKLLAE